MRKTHRDGRMMVTGAGGSRWAASAFLLLLGILTAAAFQIRVPPTHTTLSGDLVVRVVGLPAPSRIRSTSIPELQLVEHRAEAGEWALVKGIPIVVASRRPNRTSSAATLTPVEVRFPCGLLTRGGRYGVRLAGIPAEEYQQVVPLDVRWPEARLLLSPQRIPTYPEEPVMAAVEFPGSRCPPAPDAPMPESWLELLFCGHSAEGCTDLQVGADHTGRRVLHMEQVLGFPQHLSMPLRCFLFGIAGVYALRLRPSLLDSKARLADSSTVQTAWPVNTLNGTLRAEWSERFVLNVHAGSIHPCPPHSGISVLFTYPSCAENSSMTDRVRVFGRERADVTSLAPPSSLIYVAEQSVPRGAHALHFDCDLFSERFIEYCFVYVSQAVTGAVADVRMDCVPTLPVAEADSGAWGPWSAWSECSTTCGPGSKNRYRYCDSPRPRYGARFCQGPSFETGRCGPSGQWDCAPIGVSSASDSFDPDDKYEEVLHPPPQLTLPADRAEVRAEIGPGCRCGCVVHLGASKPRRLLASSSKSCQGRALWLVQADPGEVVYLQVLHWRLACGAQWLKVRDGDSLAGRLLDQLTTDDGFNSDGSSHHRGSQRRPVSSSGNSLLIEFYSDEFVAALGGCEGGFMAQAKQTAPHNETVFSHLAPGDPGSAAVIATIRWLSDYQLTMVHVAAAAFLAAIILLSGCVCLHYGHRYRKYQLAAAKEDLESLTENEDSSIGVLRAPSSSTDISEVLSIKDCRVMRNDSKDSVAISRDEEKVQSSKEKSKRSSFTENQSNISLVAETTELIDPEKKVPEMEIQIKTDAEPSSTANRPDNLPASKFCELPGENSSTTLGPSGSTSSDSCSSSCGREGEGYKKHLNCELFSVSSCGTGTGTPGGSTASISHRTNRPQTHKHLALRSSPSSSPAVSPVTSIRTGSPRSWSRSSGRSSIRSNPKENKDRRNRERLLQAAGGSATGSDFSLGPDGDLELDYYDYDVHNTRAAPGSLLAMDPAYLLWIPPFTPGSWKEEEEDEEDEDTVQEEEEEEDEEKEKEEKAEKESLLIENCSEPRDTATLTRLSFKKRPSRTDIQIHSDLSSDIIKTDSDDSEKRDSERRHFLKTIPNRRRVDPELYDDNRRSKSKTDLEKESLLSSSDSSLGIGSVATMTLRDLSSSPRRMVDRLNEKTTLQRAYDDIRFADEPDDDCELVEMKTHKSYMGSMNV